MSRERKEDFQKLVEFLRNYAISSEAGNQSFQLLLKQLHGKLFSLLTLVVEIESLNPELQVYSEDSLSYSFECASDLAQSLFCWVHGAYKPADLMLRSSIETFVKAACGTEIPPILSERSLYQVMDYARASNACGAQLVAQYFARIQNEYALLCAVAHSATADRQTQVQALRMFPKFDPQNAEAFGRRFVVLTERYMAILLANNDAAFRKAHYKNQQIVLDALPREIKQELFAEPQS